MELLEDPMYLALPREHPLARPQARCAWRSCSEEAWVQTSRASACARHVRALPATPRASSRACRSRATTTRPCRASSAAGVGVALIPELALSVVREDIVIRALSPAPPAREVIAAVPPGRRLAPAAPAMLGILEAASRRWAKERTSGSGRQPRSASQS